MNTVLSSLLKFNHIAHYAILMVFASAAAANAADDRLNALGVSVAKSFSCMRIINYYAQRTDTPGELVSRVIGSTNSKMDTILFGNLGYSYVCGKFVFSDPDQRDGLAEKALLKLFTFDEVDYMKRIESASFHYATTVLEPYKSEETVETKEAERQLLIMTLLGWREKLQERLKSEPEVVNYLPEIHDVPIDVLKEYLLPQVLSDYEAIGLDRLLPR